MKDTCDGILWTLAILGLQSTKNLCEQTLVKSHADKVPAALERLEFKGRIRQVGDCWIINPKR